MRWLIAGLAGLLMAVVFVLTTPDEVATDPTIAPLPDPTTTEIADLDFGRSSVIEGALPDGTRFLVTVDPGVADDWSGSTAGVVIEIEGEPGSVGMLEFHLASNEEYSFADGLYRIPAAGRLVTIDFDDRVLEALGVDAPEIITSSIRGAEEAGHPVLEVDHPFRWAEEGELTTYMETRYPTLSVRRGCSDLAAACSPDRAVQVIWRAYEMADSPPLVQPDVSIEHLASTP